MAEDRPHSARPRHGWLYALPNARLPHTVDCASQRYDLVETYKHDFFAATGLYRGDTGLAVLKLNRVQPVLFVPLRWIGRLLAAREIQAYQAAAGIRGIPALLGTVGDTGLMHAYVPGRPLQRRDTVSDTFFAELRELLDRLHQRHMAYVDLNKRQNIILGEDGRPYLVDFQISLWWPPSGWRKMAPARWLLARFQRGDDYHFLKHKRRLRPDQLTDADRRALGRISFWIRLHRAVTRPLTHVRRFFLRRLRAGDDQVVAGWGAK